MQTDYEKKYIKNELLKKYNTQFNDLYDNIVNINSYIQNKEELIIKENNEIERKDMSISILYRIMILLLLFVVILIIKYFNLISLNTIFLLSILLIIGFLISIYQIYYKIQNIKYYANNVLADMKKYVNDPLGSSADYHCPSKCTNNNDNDNIDEESNQYKTKGSPTLNINPQVNVWKYGDIPDTLYTSPQTPSSDFYNIPLPNYRNPISEEGIDPQQKFGSTYPTSTYYECQFMGSSNGGLPNKETEKYSTIPCSYRENTKEINKYFCNSDPNKNGIQNCNKIY